MRSPGTKPAIAAIFFAAIIGVSVLSNRRQIGKAVDDSNSRRQLFAPGLAYFKDPKTTKLRSILPNKNYKITAPLPGYTFENILEAIPAFQRELLLVIYSSQTDEFVVALPHRPAIHPDDVECDLGCKRIKNVGRALFFALRTKFPQRFPYQNNVLPAMQQNPVGDFMFLVATGDSPRIFRECALDPIHCNSKKFAPILNFGSGFEDPSILPSLIIMPPEPRVHLRCMSDYQQLGEVCEFLSPMKDGSRGLVFEEHIGMGWDDLIPQVVWRGTDFPYIKTLRSHLRKPDLHADVLSKLEGMDLNTESVIHALKNMQDNLLPRWKAALITAEAELEASKSGSLPWANMKLSSFPANHEKVVNMMENEYYRQWLDLGISVVGEEMPLTELAKYKYHVDIGGGGGTTWTGTIQKLAMPGILFHHVTPTKDWYFDDEIKPWTHYIPIKEDLSDLREKVRWVETHDAKARQIARAGTAFVKSLGTPKVLDNVYHKYVLDPLSKVIDAYEQPVNVPLQSLFSQEFNGLIRFKEIMRCTGENLEDCNLQ